MHRLQAFNKAKEFDNFDSQSPVLSKLVPRYLHFDNVLNDFDSASRNRLDEPWVEQRVRPRRNRKSETIRSMVRENIVTPRYLL